MIEDQPVRLGICGFVGSLVIYELFFGLRYIVDVLDWNVIVSEHHTHVWMVYVRTITVVLIIIIGGVIGTYSCYKFLRSRRSSRALSVQVFLFLLLSYSSLLLVRPTLFPYTRTVQSNRMQVYQDVHDYRIALVQIFNGIPGFSGALEVHITHRDGRSYRQTLDISLRAACTELAIQNTVTQIEFLCQRPDFPAPTLSVDRETQQITIRTPGGESTYSVEELVSEEEAE